MSSRVSLLDRLDALSDEDLVTLHRLFEELQLATVEAAQADDFTTFMCSALYFAAIQDTSSVPLLNLDLPPNSSKYSITPVSSFLRHVKGTSTNETPLSQALLDTNASPRGKSRIQHPSPSIYGKQGRKRKRQRRESRPHLITASFEDEGDAESFSKLDTPVAKSEESTASSTDEEMNEWLVGDDTKPLAVQKAVKVRTSAFNSSFDFKTNPVEQDITAAKTSPLGNTRISDEDDFSYFDEAASASWRKGKVEYGSPRFSVQDAIERENGQERLAGTHDRLGSSGLHQEWDRDTHNATCNRDHIPSPIVPTANVPNDSSASGKRFPISGFVYLLQTPHSPFLSGVGELSIGIILNERDRGKGLAKDALDQVLQIAFDKIQCQRVQAQIIDGPLKGDVLKLFTKLRFGHEGTRRRSFFSPFMQEWKDTTCLAMLATDWVIRSSLQPAPPSLWDEMFLRHDRERDALLRWDQGVIDEQRRLLHRTTSMETIRDLRVDHYQENSDAESVASAAKGKEKELASQSEVFMDEASDPEYQLMESDDEGWSSEASGGACSPPLSVSSSGSSRGSFTSADVSDVLGHLTPRSDGYVSSDGSQWDMLETSSSASFDSLSESDYRGR